MMKNNQDFSIELDINCCSVSVSTLVVSNRITNENSYIYFTLSLTSDYPINKANKPCGEITLTFERGFLRVRLENPDFELLTVYLTEHKNRIVNITEKA